MMRGGEAVGGVPWVGQYVDENQNRVSEKFKIGKNENRKFDK
jgi:hypothetical protein